MPGLPDDPALTAVRPGDILRIQVWPEADLGGDFPVEETGYVYLPVIGRIDASGRTLPDLRTLLRNEFGEVMKTPVVTITPRFRVTVMGAVNRPGLYTIDPTVSFYDLITMAGGFSERADEDDVRLYREGEIYQFDAAGALTTGDFSTAPQLQSGDRVLVPRGFRMSWQTVRWTIQLVGTGLTLYRLFTIKL